MNKGDKVWVTYYQMGTVAEYTFEGNNQDRTDQWLLTSDKGTLHSISKSVVFKDKDEACLRLYLYKLPLLQKKIDEHKRSLDKDSKELSQLTAQFGYLKDKFPEEFI